MDPVRRAQLHSCSPTCCINLHRFFPNWPMPVWWPLNKSAPRFTRFLFGISVFDQNYFPLGGWASTRIGWNIARLAKRSDISHPDLIKTTSGHAGWPITSMDIECSNLEGVAALTGVDKMDNSCCCNSTRLSTRLSGNLVKQIPLKVVSSLDNSYMWVTQSWKVVTVS